MGEWEIWLLLYLTGKDIASLYIEEGSENGNGLMKIFDGEAERISDFLMTMKYKHAITESLL